MSPFNRQPMTFYECLYSNYGSYLVSFLRYSMSKIITTLKSQSKANHGHWKWYHSTDWLRFLKSVL